MRRVVVAGGSIAAVTAAEALRLQGFDGELTLVSEEAHAPYSRVPLSKGVLSGKETLESAHLPALSDGIDLQLSARAVELRPAHRRVVLADGTELPYDGLVIATGSRARRLSRPGQVGEHVVRTMDDSVALAAALVGARKVVVVGGGFLGMEVASTCNYLGLDVTVVDREPPLRRLIGSWLAELVTRRAQERGVKMVMAPDGVELLGDPVVTGVDCGEGGRLDADVVVTAIGDSPNVEWLADSGLPVDGGVAVDEFSRVAPGIVAAGDVTVTSRNGAVRRTPHWTAAVQQAQVAARTLLAGPAAEPPRPDPYFWTEQFGLDLKVSGYIPDLDEPVVLDGGVSESSFLVQWCKQGRPVAAASINRPMPIVKLKKLGAFAPA